MPADTTTAGRSDMTAATVIPIKPPSSDVIPVDRLRFHPRNIRADLGDLRELTASIAAEGVLQPLLVHRKGSVLEVVDGHRRLAAARLANLRRVPAVIVDELDDDEAITKMLATTLRAGISREERRRALLALHEEFGHTVRGLADRYGVHVNTIHDWMATPTEVKQRKRKARLAQVACSRVAAVADAWDERAKSGLTPEQAQTLLSELRTLAVRPVHLPESAPEASDA